MLEKRDQQLNRPHACDLDSTYLALQRQREAINKKLQEANIKLISTEGELEGIIFYLNSILSHISQGLIFINLEGQITTCNQAAETLLGVKSEHILFQEFKEVFPDGFFGFSLSEALLNRKAPDKSFITFEKEESKKEVEIEVIFVLQGSYSFSNVLQGIIILMRDITEFQKLQEAVQRRDRLHALGEMAAMVAHEIRNPLGSIKGFASLLKRDLQKQPALYRMANDIMEGVDTLNRLVTNILNYSSPMHPEFQTIDLVRVVKDLCRQLEADESLHGRIVIEFVSPLKELFIVADEGLLKSALLNLVANAIQAMPKGGMISLLVGKEKKHAVIQVRDTGIGIAPQHLKKLFSPLFTTKEQGHGFGLAEVHKVVLIHSGTIDVDSQLNKGTAFTISLPIVHTN